MKIIYLHQYFRKPDEWGSTRSYSFAKALAEAGHEVHLISGYEGDTKTTKAFEGFTIHYLPIKYNQKFNFIQRGLSYFKFAIAAWKEAKMIGSQQGALVYASSTPLTIGITALLLKRFQKLPYLFEVRDLWPEAPITMGYIRNSLLKNILYKFTEHIYKNAKAIISLSPGITDGIKKYNTQTPIHELSNFSDTSLFKPLTPNPELKAKYLNGNEKGIIYFGAIGKANHLEYFLDIAAESQKANLPLRFFTLGDGSEKERLQAITIEMKLENILFLAPIPKSEIPDFLSIMDFSYISFLNIEILGTCSPNKLYDSLSAAKLSITNTRGWMRNALETNQCGFYADPLNPTDFIEQIKPFLHDEHLLQSFQNNARALAISKYSSEVIGNKLVEIIAELKGV